MRNQTGTPQGDGPEIEEATHHTTVRQTRHWMAAHRLAAHRGCTGFRIDELGLAHLLPLPDSDRSPRPGRPDGSDPRFASAATWRK